MQVNFKQKYRESIVNKYTLIVFILFAAVSHFIALKIILIPYVNVPVMFSTFTYTLVLTLTNFVRAYSSKRNAIYFIIIEMIFVFLILFIPFKVFNLSSPAWAYIPNLNTVFKLSTKMYIANFAGIFITLLLDVWLFSLFYKKLLNGFKIYWRFFLSSLISTGILLSLYTYITDYLFYNKLFPKYWLVLTNSNVISNILMVIIYTLLVSFILKLIMKYIKT